MKKLSALRLYHVIKLAIFAVLALLVLIFRDLHIANIRIFVSGLMILYGIEEIVFEMIFKRESIFHLSKTYLGIFELILGLTCMLASLPSETVFVVWASWSILRESYELKEIVHDLKAWLPRILSGVESILVILLSILLIFNPTPHHAIIHMYLLVVELILTPAVPLIDEIINEYNEKKKEKEEEK